MRQLGIGCLVLAMSATVTRANVVTVNHFNNSTQATVTFVEGANPQQTDVLLLSQYNVTFTTTGGESVNFQTFNDDLTHTVTVGQTYAVFSRNDLDTAFPNGGRMAFVYQNYGMENLTNNPDQAAAVQLVIWDLLLNTGNPPAFAVNSDGSYSSGTSLTVAFGANPDAATIIALANNELAASIGATTAGGWFDASAAGNTVDRGQSLLGPVPEPSTLVLSTVAVGFIGAHRCRRRALRMRAAR